MCCGFEPQIHRLYLLKFVSRNHKEGHFTHKTKVHDYRNVRALIGRKGRDRPSVGAC
jgi:hypothetical protein